MITRAALGWHEKKSFKRDWRAPQEAGPEERRGRLRRSSPAATGGRAISKRVGIHIVPNPAKGGEGG